MWQKEENSDQVILQPVTRPEPALLILQTQNVLKKLFQLQEKGTSLKKKNLWDFPWECSETL